jgi:hypothetical protein
MAVSQLEVDGVVFPPLARPPGSAHSHFLAGAGNPPFTAPASTGVGF